MNAHLPPGWRVSNSQGSWSANPAPPQSGSGPSLEPQDLEDLKNEEVGIEDDEDLRPDSPGWEDMEEDVEPLSIKCLMCGEHFQDVRPMVSHISHVHGIDLDRVRKEHHLDFLGTIKLVNYLRALALTEGKELDLDDREKWSDDKFLQPVLEDDALLYSIPELANNDDPSDPLLLEKDEDSAEGPDATGLKASSD